ncbi:DNA/RNA helicase domain-containing protein [Flavitalea antarctica]
MIVYNATKAQFNEDVFDDIIDKKILGFFKDKLGRTTSKNEISSWRNSLSYMSQVLQDPEIPRDCGVALEYQIPQSGKRLDFILTGTGENNKEYAVLIELKQWETSRLSTKDAIVYSFVGGNEREMVHPSYQAWSYADLLQNFNETVEKDRISLTPCAYLHNYHADNVITNEHYKYYLDKAPVFLRGEGMKLRTFIKKHIRFGDKGTILYKIENGRIRPSKMLADSMVNMLKGKQEFVMIDDQKVVFEAAMQMVSDARADKKKVLIVQGGPGTGKSVVAINLLVEITKRKMLVQYVSKNAAPRAVYLHKLTETRLKGGASNLFKGSGSFMDTSTNEFQALIIDEAHRLNEKSGLFGNLGENQVKEIINSALCSVFFLDEDQRVTLKDIGSIDEIKKWAAHFDAEVVEVELSSQFRCNGSDGYLAWLDHTLQIRDTANTTLEGLNYEMKIFDSPTDLKDAIEKKNALNNKARLVAGYCWKWNSKNNGSEYDIIFDRNGFKMRWNLSSDGSLWIISKESVNEVGCIHTCQGLEVDYIGVIIGPDLLMKDGKLVTNPHARASSDKSVFGYKKLLKESPEETKVKLDLIIKNTYRTLMTRGMKGCYIYCVDKQLETYFRSRF